MSGSRRWFQYTSDNGLTYQVELDESNGETPILGFTAVDAATQASGRVARVSATRPLQLRYVIARATDADGRVVQRKFYVGSTSAIVWDQVQAPAFSADGLTFAVTSFVGEKRFIPPIRDTALIDGDVDDNIVTGAV